MTIFVTFRIYEILLTMRTLLIVIIAVHSLVDKIKSVLQTPQPERNPEDQVIILRVKMTQVWKYPGNILCQTKASLGLK